MKIRAAIMKSIQVGHLKAEFSAVLERVQKNGETFVIEYGRQHRKIAMIVPYKDQPSSNSPRVFGILKNQASCQIKKNFSLSDKVFLGDE